MTRTKAAKPETELEPGTTDALKSFEATLERLHQIVERLEGGELDLEESLRLFEEGVRLSRASQARLNSAEKRVEELLAVDANGQPIVRELDITP
ncbi:MAG TPA: exodeoxyribonuclease VII small subunit [Polyangiaceae bacterium]|jgi:exodeoxyribonuclease VII small subunit|nr:exodeoxyribonuclease VII small subunit [Polyangiaceae bacterium]